MQYRQKMDYEFVDFVIVVIVIDNADIFRHAISRHHAAGSFRRLLNIAGCACRNVIKNDFFSDSAAEDVNYPQPDCAI